MWKDLLVLLYSRALNEISFYIMFELLPKSFGENTRDLTGGSVQWWTLIAFFSPSCWHPQFGGKKSLIISHVFSSKCDQQADPYISSRWLICSFTYFKNNNNIGVFSPLHIGEIWCTDKLAPFLIPPAFQVESKYNYKS